MRKRTIRCAECGHENVYAPEHWIDFGNWVCGYPKSIACGRCGGQVPLQGQRGAFQGVGLVFLGILGVLVIAVVGSLVVLVLKLLLM